MKTLKWVGIGFVLGLAAFGLAGCDVPPPLEPCPVVGMTVTLCKTDSKGAICETQNGPIVDCTFSHQETPGAPVLPGVCVRECSKP